MWGIKYLLEKQQKMEKKVISKRKTKLFAKAFFVSFLFTKSLNEYNLYELKS